jgi:hypothetical protein
VVVALEGEAVAEYYSSVFAADWSGGRGFGSGLGGFAGIATVAVVAGAVLVWRRVRFEALLE